MSLVPPRAAWEQLSLNGFFNVATRDGHQQIKKMGTSIMKSYECIRSQKLLERQKETYIRNIALVPADLLGSVVFS